MSLSIEDIKNLKLPLHMVISIIIFTLGTVSIIDNRYAHKEEVANLKHELEEREATIKRQQEMMYNYFTKVLETKKNDPSKIFKGDIQ